MKKAQLEFTTILNDAFAQYERKIFIFMATNREKYEGFARLNLEPKSHSRDEVLQRIAFAILSANAPFDYTIKALNVVIKKDGKIHARDIMFYKMVPAKAKYIRELYAIPTQVLLRQRDESWHEYRMRLKARVKGLGLAKASFAASLLYPLEADLACVDTWIQKVFLGHTGFKSLGLMDYLTVEAKIRTYANAFGCSTFLAQWMIWDHARKETNSHAIFPGSHK